MNKFITIIDESGEFRPMAGIWRDTENGRYSAEKFIKSKDGEGCKLVLVELKIVD